MARRRFQLGSLFQRGKRPKVWVARWWEEIIKPDGSIGRRRRVEVLGTVAELRTRSKAMDALSRLLIPINSGMRRPSRLAHFQVSCEGLPDIEYPFHDKTIVVTNCGRICRRHKKINFSTVFAVQDVGIKEVHDDIWLVSFMDYDLGYFDLETRVLEPIEDPFGRQGNE